MRNKPFVYSDLSMESYRLVGCGDCEVRAIEDMLEKRAVWNMFWLSSPTLDLVPSAGADWHRVYSSTGMLPALVTDVSFDPVLKFRAVQHPRTFIEWFEQEDYSIYTTYDEFGEPWVETVLARAEMAARRVEAIDMSFTKNVVALFR